ncbi:MAG: replication initiation protein [Thiofilum sp.]|nr:replication initiation protein [Thiofilum sp.]
MNQKKYRVESRWEKIYAAWLSYVEYVEGSGVIRVEFHKSLKPYLLQLHKSFTQYKLNHVMSFKSSYSIRLYELLKMEVWKAEKANKSSFERVFTLEEYRDLLGINKKEYLVFADFRKRVIEPTVKEISDNTDLNIFEVHYIKTGRKITGIHFMVLIRSESETSAQVAQLQIGQEPKEKPEIHPAIESLMNYGFTFEVAKNYKNKYGVKQIERNIAYMLGEDKKDPIHNKAGYLSKAIPQDWGNALEVEEQKRRNERYRKS